MPQRQIPAATPHAVHSRRRIMPSGRARPRRALAALPTPWLPRPRLQAQIEALGPGDIALLSAPAGYGKTALVAEWARSVGLAIAWVSFDRPRTSTSHGLARIAATVRGALQGHGLRAASLSGAVASDLCAEVERADLPFVLVLDDVDTVADEAILDVLRDLVSGTASHALTILLARGAPTRLPLARWRWQGRLVELGADALAFTADEVSAYLRNSWNLDLDDAAAARARQWTDGWPAALRLLASQSQHQPGVPLDELYDRTPTLSGQFLAAVLDRESADDVDLLIRSSVLEGLTADSCAEVIGADVAAARLRGLAARGLLLEGSDGGYRHRRPLGDLLRGELSQRGSAEVGELERRAVRALAAQGQPVAAVNKALEAGHRTLALGLLESGRDAVLEVDGGSTFERLATCLDPAEVAASSSLVSTLVDVAVLSRSSGTIRELVATLGPWSDEGPAGALLYAQASLARLSGAGRGEVPQWPDDADVPAVAHLRGVEEGWDGRHAQADASLRAALADAARRSDRLRELVVLADLVWERARSGHVTAAELFIGRALQLSNGLGLSRPPAYVTLARAQVAIDRGQWAVARGHVQQVEATIDAVNDPTLYLDLVMTRARTDAGIAAAAQSLRRLRALGGSWRGRCGRAFARRRARADAILRLRNGDVSGAVAAVPHLFANDDHGALRPVDRLLLARLLLHRGTPERARTLAASISVDVSGPRLAIEAARIQAQAQRSGGDRPGANMPRRVRRGATAETLAAGVLRSGATVAGRGTAVAGARKTRTAVSDVPETGAAGGGPFVMVEALTPRERAVLRLLPSHLSYGEMARELHISLNTVKSHLKSIYRKLDAPSRRDAVDRARDVGLIIQPAAALHGRLERATMNGLPA